MNDGNELFGADVVNDFEDTAASGKSNNELKFKMCFGNDASNSFVISIMSYMFAFILLFTYNCSLNIIH